MEKTKEDYLIAMNQKERTLYGFAMRTIAHNLENSPIQQGLLKAVSEAEKGNYIPLREQEDTLIKISEDF